MLYVTYGNSMSIATWTSYNPNSCGTAYLEVGGTKDVAHCASDYTCRKAASGGSSNDAKCCPTGYNHYNSADDTCCPTDYPNYDSASEKCCPSGYTYDSTNQNCKSTS